ncbi:hypothetical protein HanXRQr2_Chr15g0690741 [Helianthus annuus]|uniref:Uncharacterized protein n=1 Tax=Helianthus annuus TaxID=4232 RepID=A0A9K3DZI0_HELAN|nr:hypothetical protein HanXRQr2_Chr15g0690741 [Helianthus annuus]KAJ0831051.1 hypothetical protein HanPSC8_Chr15g0662561 [Helianthus annuus]
MEVELKQVNSENRLEWVGLTLRKGQMGSILTFRSPLVLMTDAATTNYHQPPYFEHRHHHHCSLIINNRRTPERCHHHH